MAYSINPQINDFGWHNGSDTLVPDALIKWSLTNRPLKNYPPNLLILLGTGGVYENYCISNRISSSTSCCFGAKDYRAFRTTLKEMDRILTATGIEHQMLVQHLESSDRSRPAKYSQRRYKTLRLALRDSILLGMTDLSYRELSHRVADSSPFQWFTHTERSSLADQLPIQPSKGVVGPNTGFNPEKDQKTFREQMDGNFFVRASLWPHQ